MSVVWSCEHFKCYIYEKEFEIETDNKALDPILNGNRGAKPHSSQLTEWAPRLMLFDFTISYRPGNTMGITEYLSQHPVFEAQRESNYEEKFVVNHIKEINRLIGTGYTEALNRLIKTNIIESVTKGEQIKYDEITKEEVMCLVIEQTEVV